MKMFIYLYNSHAYQDIQQSNCLQSWGTLLVQTPQWSPAHCHLQQQARVNRLKLDNLRNDSRLNFLQLSCKCWLPPWWFAHLLLIPQVQAIQSGFESSSQTKKNAALPGTKTQESSERSCLLRATYHLHPQCARLQDNPSHSKPLWTLNCSIVQNHPGHISWRFECSSEMLLQHEIWEDFKWSCFLTLIERNCVWVNHIESQ